MLIYNTQICVRCRKRFNCSTYRNHYQSVPHLIDTNKCGFFINTKRIGGVIYD